MKVKKGHIVGLEKWIGEVSRRMRADCRSLEERMDRRFAHLEERIDRSRSKR